MMPFVDDYLALRRAAGFKIQATEYRLRSFARFAEERGEKHIRAEMAITWAASAASPRQRHVRLRDLAIFTRHLRAEDPTHEMPDVRMFPRDRRERLPHIFSDEEIARILEAAARLGTPGTSQADTYKTLFGLLAATGLRIGEACRLKVADLSADGLRILNTKFHKSRLLPLHPTAAAALCGYRARWRLVAGPDDPFFVSTRGTALGSAGARDTFHRIVRGLGLCKDTGPDEHRRPNPCPHDLRHSFAVRSLEASPAGGAAINRHILALATYLGHASVASTYWYLRATPSLMADIADACEAWRLGGAR